MHELSLLIGGEAGQGIESSGHMLGLSFARAGLHVFAMNEFASQIRGGHNFHKVRVSDSGEIYGHLDKVNILVCLNKETYNEHIDEVVSDGVIIGEEAYGDNVLVIPFGKIVNQFGGNSVMKNTVGLGAVLALIDFPLDNLMKVFEEKFEHKDKEIVKLNHAILKAGYDFVKENFKSEFSVRFKARFKAKKRALMFLNGNDAICLGALKAGCKFVAEYPMTPSSSILHIMASYAYDYGIVVKHTEDEIAAVNMLTGAAFAGVRCMTGTSGGGFALMTEGCGVAGMAELPIVIVNVQRPGSSTGLPTRTEQGDLRQVMHAGQGDYPRVVIAPGSLDECFYETHKAFNIADKYQLPVFILSDKYLGEAAKSREVFDENGMKIDRGKLVDEVPEDYKRFGYSEDGVSKRVLPGTNGGIHLASSYEHDEYGFHTEDPLKRSLMVEKRMKKMEGALAELEAPLLYGDKNASVTLVTWGSSVESCMAALPILKDAGVSANILQIKYFVPFHSKEIAKILKGCKKTIAVEMNYTAQMAGVIRENTGIELDGALLNYCGRPFTGCMVAEGIIKQL